MKITLWLLTWLLLGAASLASAADHAFKIATLAPDGTAWMKEMRAGADAIAKQTAGRVAFKFYPGGVMGNDATVLRKIQIGQLQGGAITVLAVAHVYPDSQLYGLPLLFRSYEEVDYVRSRMDATLLAGLEKEGLVAFGLAEGGFAYVMSNAPVRRISDLRTQRAWAPEGDAVTRTMFEVGGVAPVVLPLADVYTGLQTGLVSAVGISPAGAIALQWYTKTKYLTDIPIYYTAGILALDKRAYSALSAADQQVVRGVLVGIFEKLDRASRRDNEAARAALKDHGIEFVQLGAEDIEDIERVAAEARTRLGQQGLYTSALLQALEGHLKEFRAQGRGVDGRR